MRSTMQGVGLQIRRLLEHGSRIHGDSRIVTAGPHGPRSATFAETGRNAARLAHALRSLGVRGGDRVATFMWNNQEHTEVYFAVPAMGAIVHPLNIRLFPEQVEYIADHAQDKVVIVDHTLVGTLATILPGSRAIEHVIVNGPADLSPLDGLGIAVHSYQELTANAPASYAWPDIDENAPAAMCYTSGTTGDPKGVVYSHRSVYLHALASSLPDAFGLSERDLVLAIVPQFHVMAWGLPYAAFLTGASLAMPDRFLSPEPLAEFIQTVRPTKGAGVPTVWSGLLQYARQKPTTDLSSLQEAVVGGSAMPESLMQAFAEEHGVTTLHAWGMTEMSPLGTIARPPATAHGDTERTYQLTQGRFLAPVEAKIIDGTGAELPWDDASVGELLVRGPWITATYVGDGEPDPDKFDSGWLRTGDVGRISPDGYLTLTDRAKDVIKSGGEWISSVELENHLMGHPAVAEAAVVGVPDDRWGERPLAVVVAAPGHDVTTQELREFLSSRIARWQLPERWAFVTEVPRTSVGKFDKKELRRLHADGLLSVTVQP
ncbi:long-chain fatty acid--CoA ligase [Streptomyces sp. NPDC059455]|uniref:long-chain fatty acid--CoA ligase n=1 Tax=Streptomyces sp. NPDC059455 TaxID=3346837 RepID=UPI00368CF7CB